LTPAIIAARIDAGKVGQASMTARNPGSVSTM
jgi:hypothetical protein